MISVLIITYNQISTLSQAVEGILMQVTTEPVEIIIADDASVDGSRELCKAFMDKHPDKIKLVLQEHNKGIVGNFVDGIKKCSGDYLCICAGDDYWIDDRKLEKQLDFFKDHPDYGVVSTNGYRLITKTNKLIEGIAPLDPPADGEVFERTWTGGVYAMPLSLMIKSNLLDYVDFDEFVKRKFSVEDVPLQAILAAHTKFGHIPDLTCVYRVSSKSATFTTLTSGKYLDYHIGLIEIRRYLHELFPERVQFSEVWANNYIAYRKFLIAAVSFNFTAAQKAVKQFIEPGQKETRAMRISTSSISFYSFAILKTIKTQFELWKRSLC